MNILQQIVAYKKEELKAKKKLVTAESLVDSKYFLQSCLSLKKNLLKKNASGIIAEFKRKSPSKGFINEHADVVQVTSDYKKYGASGLSVLTDSFFFGGSENDILRASENNIPVLNKEFIIDPYQVFATKAIGADVILLIAAVLTKEEVKRFARSAKELGLEILLEIHDKSELGHICNDIDMVGINNRNLRTFKVDINHSVYLSKLIPGDKIKIAESGIESADTVKMLREEGFKGFLIGEKFMKESNPGLACNNFIKQLK